MPAFLVSGPNRCCRASPQNTASDVGTESTPHRKSHFRRASMGSANFVFSGLSAGESSQALTKQGTGFSNHVRYLSYAAAINESTVKSLRSCSTRMACNPRAVSPPVSTYKGKSSFFGLSGPAADHGQLFEL